MARQPGTGEGPPWPKDSVEPQEGGKDGVGESTESTDVESSHSDLRSPDVEPAQLEAVQNNFGSGAALDDSSAGKPKSKKTNLEKKLQVRGGSKHPKRVKDLPGSPETLPFGTQTNEPFTPKEELQNLRERLGLVKKEKNEAFAAQDSELTLAEATAKEEYFAVLRKYQRNRSVMDVASERVGLKTGSVADGGELLQGLKAKWIEARVAQAKSRLGSIEERREGRGELKAGSEGIRAKSRKDRDITLIQERYADRYLRKNIAFGLVAEEQKARMEVLQTRDRNILEKAVNGYLNLSPEKRLAVSGALMGTAAFGAGAALVAGSGAAVLTLAVLASSARGAMLNWKAADLRKKAEEINKTLSVPAKENAYETWKQQTALRDEKLRQADILSKKATRTSFAALGSWVAGKLTRSFQKEMRNEAQSTIRKTLETKRVASDKSTVLDITDTEAVSRSVYEAGMAHAKLRKADAQVGAVSVAAGAATSFGAGAAIGAGVHYASEALHGDAPYVGGEAHTAAPIESGKEAISAGNVDAAPAPVAEAPHVTPTAPEGLVREISIEKGEGFNSLFAGLRESEFNGSTPVGHYLENADISPTRLSQDIGAFDPITGESMPMQVGDKLVVDAHENVWFVRNGEAPQLVLENDPMQPSGFSIHEIKDAGIQAPMPAVQEAEAPAAPEQSHENAPEEFEQSVPVPNIPSVPKVETPVDEVLRPAPSETLKPLNAHVAEPVAPEVHLPHEASPEAHHPPTSVRESHSSIHLNAHGVDLDKPDVSLAGGKYFAHGGGSNEANYELAVRFARDIGRTEPGVPVYYVEERMTVLGGLERTVRALVFDSQSGGGSGLVVPYSEGGSVIQMPPIPNPEDYEPIPNRR